MKLPDLAFVIDIETFDTRPTARIATIGIAAVCLVTGAILNTAHFLVSAQDQPFRTQSDSTMQWWARQSAETRGFAFGLPGARLAVSDALIQLAGFILSIAGHPERDQMTFGVWGYGSSFDIVVLESLYADAGIKLPWTFRQHRDLRTLYELAGLKPDAFFDDGETPHIAVDDAKAEARALIAALKSLGHRYVVPEVDVPSTEATAAC